MIPPAHSHTLSTSPYEIGEHIQLEENGLGILEPKSGCCNENPQKKIGAEESLMFLILSIPWFRLNIYEGMYVYFPVQESDGWQCENKVQVLSPDKG